MMNFSFFDFKILLKISVNERAWGTTLHYKDDRGQYLPFLMLDLCLISSAESNALVGDMALLLFIRTLTFIHSSPV